MSKKTRAIALSIIVILGILGLGYVRINYGSTPDASQAPTLGQKMSGKIQLDGKVVPEKTADLGFILAANITSIPVKIGDSVKAGDLLATQDATDLKAGVNAAQASVQSAQEELSKLNHDLKFEKLKLHGLSGNAKQQQYQQIASSQDSVVAQASAIAAAQDNLKNAQAQVDKAVLRAPFDGIITRQDGQIGEVGGVYSAPFMTIASSEAPQKIEAYASDLDVTNIKAGQSAQVTFDVLGSQKTISAKVQSVDPSTDSSQGKNTYKITLMLDQTDPAIILGMHASVTF
jgi:RND family efflux transporter MFP subunit